VKYLRFVGLDKVAGRYATEKMVSGIVRLVGEMGSDPEHPMRLRFDEFVAELIARLQDDPELRMKGEAVKQELLAHPALSGYLHGLWSQVIAWMQGDLEADRFVPPRPGRASARARWVRSLAPMQRCRAGSTSRSGPRRRAGSSAIARTFASTSSPASPTGTRPRWTNELERNIGRDLQFIRINGTLVGGLVGLAIHAATQVAHHLR
jgi:hypothetical protein